MTAGGAGRAAPPPTVGLAVNLIWVSLALTLVDVVLELFGFTPSVDAGGAADQGLDALAAEALLVDASAGSLISLAIMLGVIAALAVLVLRGVRWARLVYTVLAAANLASAVLVVLLASPGPRLALLVVGNVVIVASVVALYRRDANRYFARR